jgi:sulfhydrogenase subunit beta (sulfur reductase)
MNGAYADQDYAARRATAFILAVNCSKPSSSCFCRSTETGPQVSGGFDLAATELADLFLLDVGSEAGSQALEGAAWHAATAFEIGSARDVLREAERRITRELRTDHLGSVLFEHLESPHWKEISDRCLGCGSCTMVCPTCFCTNVCDTIGLTATTERVRLWDSCYTTEFSHVHGGNIRPTARARYRQWMTHKFATYREQFGINGCVGCGRCITWCPVQIDITEELGRFRSTGAAR